MITQQLQEDNDILNDASKTLDQIEILKRKVSQLEEIKGCLENKCKVLKGEASNKENTAKLWKEKYDELREKGNKNLPEIIIEEATNTTILNPTISSIPLINDETKRKINIVVDVETGEEINANDFFSKEERFIFKMRSELQKAIYLRKPKYICKYCGQMVKISGRKTERGAATFFSHLYDSGECDYKTTTDRTKREIECEKYSRCNEGERHKKLKESLAHYLEMTEGISNVRTENTMKGEHPILNWRRPDIAASYKNIELIFELQLSTTFVSVITERDMFYRLNKKFIIWIFNFDEDRKFMNWNNMTSKDIYYNHKLNIFLFDKDAQTESERRGELVLKCNWINPDGKWHYNIDSPNHFWGKFVTLNDLTYTTEYKPYYYDAEKEYINAHPEFKQYIINIEDENKQILKGLDQRLSEQDDQIKRIKDAFEIDYITKTTKKYIIGKRENKYGLITFDGNIRIPFEYEQIKMHRNWIEAQKNEEIFLFDRNSYYLINSEILKLEILDNELKKVAKVIGDVILWGIINKKGINITPITYSKIQMWAENKILIEENGKYGILATDGSIILEPIYEYIGILQENGIAQISFKGQEGTINKDCVFQIIDQQKINEIYNKKKLITGWGIEKTDDKAEITPCIYDDLGSYCGKIICIKDNKISIIDKSIEANCTVNVEYKGKGERNMLIFKVGNVEALMNLRQQRKAKFANITPTRMKQMYISMADIDRQLLYLSALPLRSFILNTKYVGYIIKDVQYGWIIQFESGDNVLLHKKNLQNRDYSDFKIGKRLILQKIDYDKIHKKDIWKVIDK